MPRQDAIRPAIGRPRDPIPKVMLPVKMTPDQRKRFRVVCAEAGKTYGDMIVFLLDERDRKLAYQRRQQAHPLHRPDSGLGSVTG